MCTIHYINFQAKQELQVPRRLARPLAQATDPQLASHMQAIKRYAGAPSRALFLSRSWRSLPRSSCASIRCKEWFVQGRRVHGGFCQHLPARFASHKTAQLHATQHWDERFKGNTKRSGKRTRKWGNLEESIFTQISVPWYEEVGSVS